MSRTEHFLSGAQTFDNSERVAAYRAAKTVPGHQAPVLFADLKARYKPNPFAAHLPAPVREDFEDGSYRMNSRDGIPGYSREAIVERPRRAEPVPLHRLESQQTMVSHTHATNMARRKGQAPPIEVTHHVEQDRYVIGEGNHRATVALLRGDTHIPAYVTRIRQGR